MNQALADALRWQRYAEEDLAQADHIVGQTDFTPRHAAWLAQQAVEKAIKAILVAESIRPPRTHDLELLWTLIPAHRPVKQVEVDLPRLSEYSVDARYPGDWPDITAEEAEAAVEDAKRVVAAVQADLDASATSI